MRYHFFLYYEWFLQNLRKDFIRTNMHTTVRNWLFRFKFQNQKICIYYSKQKQYTIYLIENCFTLRTMYAFRNIARILFCPALLLLVVWSILSTLLIQSINSTQMVGNLRFDSAKTASFPLRKLSCQIFAGGWYIQGIQRCQVHSMPS